MRFAVFGAGAVGSLLGARLIEAGHEVSFLARGQTLDALQRTGLSVRSHVFGDRHYRVRADRSARAIGPVDYVLLCVKAGSLEEIAPLVSPLQTSGTTFVSTQNGLPWWYFHGVPGDEPPISVVDPDGVIARSIPVDQVVGSIVYFSCSVVAPGKVVHSSGNRLPLGEPAGGRPQRIRALSAALRSAGIKAPVRNDIRHEMWVKLMGNAAFNPLSALTRKTLADLIDSPHGPALISAIMDEVREVATAVGVWIALSNERRIAGARRAGHHRTSMLQDLESGRQPELESLLGAVLELAEREHVEVPTLRAIDAATRMLFESRPRPGE